VNAVMYGVEVSIKPGAIHPPWNSDGARGGVR